ncbi:c-type cytochrome domain-containing protein [Isosphaeraceae bacterium EP7]
MTRTPRKSLVLIVVALLAACEARSSCALAQVPDLGGEMSDDSGMPAKRGGARKKGRVRRVPLKAGAEPKAQPKEVEKEMEKAAEPAETKAEAAPADAALVFSRDIAPVLVANCARCHNDKQKRGGFDQTSFAGLMKGGKTGPAIVAGKPEESRLLQMISGEETPKMPPGQTNLAPETIERIAKWVKAGAILDAGKNPTAPLASYAAKPEDIRKSQLSKLSPSERDTRLAELANERWKKASPSGPKPEMVSVDRLHFLLFGEVPKDRAIASLKVIEGQYIKLRNLLSTRGKPTPNFDEKVSIYAFKDRATYVEFVRSVENREVEQGTQAHAKLAVDGPYIACIAPQAGGAEAPATQAKKPGRSRRDEGGGAERTLNGLVAEELAIAAINQAGKPPRWVSLGLAAQLASQLEPRATYYRAIRGVAFEQVRLGWIAKSTEALGDDADSDKARAVGFAIFEFLGNNFSQAYPAFILGMLEGGNKFDEVVAACLDANRQQFLTTAGEWVGQAYAQN